MRCKKFLTAQYVVSKAYECLPPIGDKKLFATLPKVRASQCFKSFHTAERTLEGIEAVNMMRKEQVKRLLGSDAMGQAKFVESLFQIAA